MPTFTVTATAGGSTANGIGMSCRVLTFAAPSGSQPGGTATQSGAAAHEASLTTTTQSSRPFMAMVDFANTAGTVDANTGGINSFADAVNSRRYETARSNASTGTPGAITLGYTAPTDNGGLAIAEILPLNAGTATTDTGTNFGGTSATGASTLTSAAMTPVAGALIVIMIAANGGAGTTTMSVTDSYGLSWRELVKSNAAGAGYAGVWVADAPLDLTVPPFQFNPPGFISPASFQDWFWPWDMTPSSQAPQTGPPIYPLGHPVQARQPLPRGGAAASRAYPKFLDWFDGYSAISGACLANGTTFGKPPWTVLWGSVADGGCTQITGPDAPYNTVAELHPATATSSGQTFSAVLTGPQASGNFEFSAFVRTVAQLRTGSAPNNWETAWIFWDWKFPDPAGTSGYYYTIKESGTEIGRLNNGTQTVLATSGNNPGPATWHHVRVVQTAGGGTTGISVYVDGVLDLSFSDVSGSALTGGQIALYCEDAQVHFTGVALPAIPPFTAGPAVRQWDGPVQAKRPNPVPGGRGRISRNAGTFTATVATATFYPLGKPHQAQPPLARPGTADSRAGLLSGSGPPARQWDGPFRAPVPPAQRGGRISRLAGRFSQSGPPVRRWEGPVRAQPQFPALTGRAKSRTGQFSGSGPAVRQWDGPVQASRPPLPARGRINRSFGTFTAPAPQGGPPVYPLGHPVQAKPYPAPRGGTTAHRAGPYGQLGPPVHKWSGPFAARQPLPPRGRVSRSFGTFTLVIPGAGPPVYPKQGPVQARPYPPPRGGTAQKRTGTFFQTGPPVRPPDGPVVARQPLPPRGRISRNAGTFTFVVVGAGPPFYPLGKPHRAPIPPPAAGRIVRHAGTRQEGGPPARRWSGPIGVYRQQLPPPARGRVQNLRGPYGQLGPPVRPLRHALRAQPAYPVLTGRADMRAGIFTPPPPPPAIIPATGIATVSDPREGAARAALDLREGAAGGAASLRGGTTSTADPREGAASVSDPREGTASSG